MSSPRRPKPHAGAALLGLRRPATSAIEWPGESVEDCQTFRRTRDKAAYDEGYERRRRDILYPGWTARLSALHWISERTTSRRICRLGSLRASSGSGPDCHAHITSPPAERAPARREWAPRSHSATQRRSLVRALGALIPCGGMRPSSSDALEVNGYRAGNVVAGQLSDPGYGRLS